MDAMNVPYGQRYDRITARDAALRQVTWWTAALAMGGAVGTAGLALVAHAADSASAVAAPADGGAGGSDDGTVGAPGGGSSGFWPFSGQSGAQHDGWPPRVRSSGS